MKSYYKKLLNIDIKKYSFTNKSGLLDTSFWVRRTVCFLNKRNKYRPTVHNFGKIYQRKKIIGLLGH